MPELDLFLICNSFVIDKGTNRVSVFEILSEIWPQKFPALLQSAVAIAYWSFSDNEKTLDFQVIVRITPPNFTRSDLAANFVCTRTTMRTITTMLNIPLITAGRIKVEIFLNGTPVKTSYIEVHPANPNSGERLLLYPTESSEKTEERKGKNTQG